MFTDIDNVLDYFSAFSQMVDHEIDELFISSQDLGMDGCEDEYLEPKGTSSVPDISKEFINWDHVSTLSLSIQDYTEYADYLNWDIVSTHISLRTALRFKHRVNWNKILEHVQVPFHIILETKPDWRHVLRTQKLTEYQIETYYVPMFSSHKDGWVLVSMHQKLSEEFMDKYKDFLDWESLCCFSQMTHSVASRFIDKVHIDDLEWFSGLTESECDSLRLMKYS